MWHEAIPLCSDRSEGRITDADARLLIEGCRKLQVERPVRRLEGLELWELLSEDVLGRGTGRYRYRAGAGKAGWRPGIGRRTYGDRNQNQTQN
jgi:hypothetical protein